MSQSNINIAAYAASCVLLNDKDETLLFMRDDMPLWMNIGGNVEDGEDFETALHREIMEEVNLTVDIIGFAGDFYAPMGEGKYRHEKLYICRQSSALPATIGDEGTMIEWFAEDKLPINMGPRFRMRMEYGYAVYKGEKEACSMIIPDTMPGMIEFMQALPNFDGFYGMENWHNHPIVVKKRELGQLKFDVAA